MHKSTASLIGGTHSPLVFNKLKFIFSNFVCQVDLFTQTEGKVIFKILVTVL